MTYGAGVFGAGVFGVGGGVVSTAYITVGAHTFVIEGELGDLDAPVLVLDGLTIGWAVSESSPWPTQPDPVTCQLGLWTHDVANLDDVALSDPLAVVLANAAGDVVATFHGRVAAMTARTGDGPGGLAMWYSLAGVDFTVDLAELPITVTGGTDAAGEQLPWPAEPADDRFARIAAAIAAAGGPVVDVPADTGTAAYDQLDAGASSALELLADHLAQLAVDAVGRPTRYIVVPVVVDDQLDRFTCAPLANMVDASLLPATVDVVGGVLTLVWPDMDAQGVIRAADVLLETTWTRLKWRAVNDVTAAGPVTGHALGAAGPKVRLSVSHNLTDQTAADLMAAMYLPDVGEPAGWVADSFHTLGHVHPQTLTPAWFPDHREDPAATSVYVMPLAIVGIPPAINLAGELGVYAGQLVSATLTLADNRHRVEAQLRRQLPLSEGADALTWQWITDNYPGVTIADVDPDLTIYDVRLARTF
jgi:hypothetical protein